MTEKYRIRGSSPHKAIITAIRGASMEQLECLASLITDMEITVGHDDIIEAWQSQCAILDLEDNSTVVVSLTEQKERFEKEISFDEMHRGASDVLEAAHNVLRILDIKKPEVKTWQRFLRQRLEEMHRLTDRFLNR